MRRTPWTTYLWPGLAQLWLDGAWTGLLLAIGFAVVVNMLLLSSLVWVELVDSTLLRVGWAAAGVIWLCAAGLSGRRRRSSVAETAAAQSEDLFRTAQSEYLQGNWVAAESILRRVLEVDARDFESCLLLAALLRRTKRYKEARRELGCLERLDRAAAWTPEIEHEKTWLDQLEAEVNNAYGGQPAADDQTTENLTTDQSLSDDTLEEQIGGSPPGDPPAALVTRAA